MAKEKERKPLRERVAERKEREQKEKRGAKAGTTPSEEKPAPDEAERRERTKVLWERVSLLGTALQALGILLVIVEAFILWNAAGQWDRWTWLIVYCIVFAAGRVLKMVGDAQRAVRRR